MTEPDGPPARDSNEDWRRLAAQLYVTQAFQTRAAAEQQSQTYGGMALRALSLLNGGAILALLAFVGGVFEGRPNDLASAAVLRALFLPTMLYLAGLVLAPIASAVAYANWQIIATQMQSPVDLYKWMTADPEQATFDEKPALIRSTAFASLILSVLSLALFCAGTVLAAYAITRAP